ncbi:hypothetical protein [Pseudomonas huanghezhanensis]|uniref:hypothetical protein n=1 Tax=Pseudomonas huanghezhanensis TaxID=3002903 RepID=UPI002286488A|nr:hypothetical protein [Pseudomonas sp. BSw22131]
MQRLLVWPWHGLINNSSIQLPSGMTKPYTQPPNAQRTLIGAGDTHLIVVPGISPITDEELALTPPGGSYWAGRALISGNSLYNRQLDGWIYQALDGSRWRVTMLQRTISASTTRLQFSISRFGEFGVAPEARLRTVVVPLGQLSFEDRINFFSDLGSESATAVRLHSVSTSGRNAVLAWSAFNTTDQSDMDTDARLRPYSFAQVTLSGFGADVAVTVTVLYGSGEVMKVERSLTGGGQNQFALLSATEEIDREPILNEQGVAIGDKVTYNYPSSLGVVSGNGWQGPTSSSTAIKWLVMLPFEGEQPSPCYLNFTDSWAIGGASFSVATSSPRIANEYYNGEVNIVQNGVGVVSGGAVSAGNSTISWEGPGDDWVQSVSYGSSGSINGDELTLGVSIDGVQETQSYPGGSFQIGPSIGGVLEGSAIGRVPQFGAAVGSLSKFWHFSLYSNNLIAISHQVNQQPAVFEGALTPAGYLKQSGSYPIDDVRHYGSFNPASQEFVVGSPTPVNWV